MCRTLVSFGIIRCSDTGVIVDRVSRALVIVDRVSRALAIVDRVSREGHGDGSKGYVDLG